MTEGPQRRARWLAGIVVALVTTLAFLPTARNGFVSWDDRANFLSNPNFRGLGVAQLRWMWSTFHLGHYTPLTWMTLGLDYQLWGMNPAGYHISSLLVHTLSAVLVFVLTAELLSIASDERTSTSSNRIAAAAIGALIFSVHPLRVESVAWATERRDVLSLFFYLLTIVVYVRSCTRETGGTRWYWMSVFLFACALLSKASAMTLPAVLVILNVYPLRRFTPQLRLADTRRVIVELAPFAVLSLASMALSIVALRPPEQLAIQAKLAVSAYSLSFYIVKSLVPLDLSPLYEMPRVVDPAEPRFVVSALAVVLAMSAATIYRRRQPAAVACWCAFVAIALPTLGIVQNGPQIAADRYTYHASAALGVLAAAVSLVGLTKWPRITRVAGAVAIAMLAALTWHQTLVWRDSGTLWRHAIAVDDTSPIAHSALASVLYAENRLDDGVTESRRAATLDPSSADAHNNLGVGLVRSGQLAAGIAEYIEAIALKPLYDEAENNLGVALVRRGDGAAAVSHYRRALEINADNADAHVNWGNALVAESDYTEAIAHYQRALAIRPDLADAHLNWGVALARQNQLSEAVLQFREALAIDADNSQAKAFLEKAESLLR